MSIGAERRWFRSLIVSGALTYYGVWKLEDFMLDRKSLPESEALP